jgi:hypothetical protein
VQAYLRSPTISCIAGPVPAAVLLFAIEIRKLRVVKACNHKHDALIGSFTTPCRKAYAGSVRQ